MNIEEAKLVTHVLEYVNKKNQIIKGFGMEEIKRDEQEGGGRKLLETLIEFMEEDILAIQQLRPLLGDSTEPFSKEYLAEMKDYLLTHSG